MRLARLSLLLALWLAVSAAHADPIAERARADALYQAKDWAGAGEAYRALATADPDLGLDWYRLGVALARSGDCAAAEPALQTALKLGAGGSRPSLARAHVELAGCQAARGDLEAALANLSVAQGRLGFDGFEDLAKDARFTGLAADPRFRRLAGVAGTGGRPDRTAGWRSDLAWLAELVQRRHPNPFHDIGRTAWLGEVRRLRADIPRLSDVEATGRFMRLLSLIGDGHTAVYPPFDGPRSMRLLPIWPYEMGGDWYVLAAAPAHQDLVGVRILAVDGRPIGEVMAAMSGLTPHDNPRTIRWVGAVGLQFAELASLAAGSRGQGEVTLEAQGADGARRSVRLQGGPIDRDPTSRWAPAGWPSMAGPAAQPDWLARSGEPFWFTHLAEPQAVFAQVNQINDEGPRRFETFAAELGAELRRSGARRLILDLRHDNGGSGSLNWSLVREIVRSPGVDRDGGLYVIVGRRTFSAAMNLASMLETHTHAIFVGEPTGSRPNFYGEDTDFTLPWSGLKGSISSAWFQGGGSSDDQRPWIAPDLPAALTPDDLAAGRDPALSAIAAHISAEPR